MQPTTHAPILLPPMHCDAQTTPNSSSYSWIWLGSGEAYEIQQATSLARELTRGYTPETAA